MKKDELSSKDLLLCFLFSPGKSTDINEPIIGRTKLTKMMFLFEKEIYGKFFKDVKIQLPDFVPYYFGPFSKTLFDDLSFFSSIEMIKTNITAIPISPADQYELEQSTDEDLDEWAEACFDDNGNNRFELEYFLSAQGNQYVADNIWGNFSLDQKQCLQAFKAKINTISLDTLLNYVYHKYPEQTTNSKIADKYLNKVEEES